MSAQNFDKLRAGDKVICNLRGLESVSTVVRLTKTLIVLSNGKRISKRTGQEPGDHWHRVSIGEATPERLTEVRAAAEQRKLARQAHNVAWSVLSTDALKQVLAIVDANTREGE